MTTKSTKMNTIKEIRDRNEFSSSLLNKLETEISKSQIIQQHSGNLCIYATGSYARKEASRYSDLDLFFIVYKKPICNLDIILIKAELIKIMRDLNFPDFSGDGEFLNFHIFNEIIKELGSTKDDYNNFFTARLLLLLESHPLNGRKIYNEILSKIIDRYFQDYPDHEKNFRPIFLANDIIRFWKTLCLNYEHKRHRRGSNEVNKNKSHLKLKFSRLTTCYTILCCIGMEHDMQKTKFLELINKAPLERLIEIFKQKQDSRRIISQLLHLYNWFLEATAAEEKMILSWIGNKTDRDIAFGKAREYHELMYKLLDATSNDLLKYYTI